MRTPAPRLLPGLLAAAALAACQPADPIDEPAPDAEAVPETPVIEVTTTEYAFTAPPRFPSGWNTLRMINEGEQPHFLLLWRLPEGRNFADMSSEIVAPFNELYAEYEAGTLERDEFLVELGARLPDWFAELERMGGVGYTAPGRIAQATVSLPPGNYVMECYVKAPEPEAMFHNALGMLRPLIVTEEPSGVPAPDADVRITLSSYEIDVAGELTAGEHSVRVDVTEEPEGGLLGHNLQLVRLEEGDSVQEVLAWLDWVDALRPPAPVEFLGGAQQLQAGGTTYLTVQLEPGRYAWVSEGYGEQGMVSEFTIE